MQRLEVSCAVLRLYRSLGVKGLILLSSVNESSEGKIQITACNVLDVRGGFECLRPTNFENVVSECAQKLKIPRIPDSPILMSDLPNARLAMFFTSRRLASTFQSLVLTRSNLSISSSEIASIILYPCFWHDICKRISLWIKTLRFTQSVHHAHNWRPGLQRFRIYRYSSLEKRTMACTKEANLWQCLYTSTGNNDWRMPQEAHLKATTLTRISASGYDCPFCSRGRRRPSRGSIRCERQVTNI
jgi:hypothetical protein